MKIITCVFILISTVTVSANNVFEDIKTYVEQLVSNIDDGVNQCANDYNEAISNRAIFWKMIDASAIPLGNGFIQSGGVSLGSFDECLEIDHQYVVNNENNQLRGKFCAPLLALPYSMLETIFGMPVAELAPDLQYQYMTLSGCIPDSCQAEDLRQMLNNSDLSSFITNSSIEMCVNVDSGKDFDTSDIVVITLFCIILFLMLISTTYDVIITKIEQPPIHPIFLAFSVYTNGKRLLAVSSKPNKEQVQIFHGFKFISTIWIIAYHSSATYLSAPVINRVEPQKWKTEYRYSQYVLNADMAVDTFIFMSGFLLAYMYIKPKVPQKPWLQIKSIPYTYIHRYMRLTPAFLMVYLMTISFYKHLGDGPLNKVNSLHETCTKYWWTAFLYIQNYYNYDDLCLVHTWYLSADMQLFLLSPLVLIPVSLYIRKKYKMVMWALAIVNTIFVLIPLITDLAAPDYTNGYGIQSRLCIFSFGITLAVYMRINMDKPYPVSKKLNFILWVCALDALLAAFLLHGELTLYGSFSHTSRSLISCLIVKPLWSAGLAWIIFSSHNGHGGIVNWILTRPIFQVGGKLSYCMYLLHINVIGYILLTIRTRLYFSDYNQYYLWCGHLITTIILSFIWTLAFEIPIITIDKYTLGTLLAPKRNESPKPKTDIVAVAVVQQY